MHKNCMDSFFVVVQHWLVVEPKNWLHKYGQRAILQLFDCLLNKNITARFIWMVWFQSFNIVIEYVCNMPTMPASLYRFYVSDVHIRMKRWKTTTTTVIHSSNHFYRRSEITFEVRQWAIWTLKMSMYIFSSDSLYLQRLSRAQF